MFDLLGLLDRLGLCAKRKVSAEQAVSIARDECIRRGITWDEPIHVERGFREWRIMTNCEARGGNVCISVDSRDGHVHRFFHAPH